MKLHFNYKLMREMSQLVCKTSEKSPSGAIAKYRSKDLFSFAQKLITSSGLFVLASLATHWGQINIETWPPFISQHLARLRGCEVALRGRLLLKGLSHPACK